MTDVKLKEMTSDLADIYIKNEELFLDTYDFLAKFMELSLREWYVVGKLIDIYINIKLGSIDRPEGIKQQEEVFCYANSLR